MYLLNAFSLQIVAESEVTIRFREIPAPSRDELQALDSAIGHQDTAEVAEEIVALINQKEMKKDEK